MLTDMSKSIGSSPRYQSSLACKPEAFSMQGFPIKSSNTTRSPYTKGNNSFLMSNESPIYGCPSKLSKISEGSQSSEPIPAMRSEESPLKPCRSQTVESSSNSKVNSSPIWSPRQSPSMASTMYKPTTSPSDNNAFSSNCMSSTAQTPSMVASPREFNLKAHSTAKNLKSSKVFFTSSSNEILGNIEVVVPEILQVFTDLDVFIERELSELATRRRIAGKLSEQKKFETESDVFKSLKDEYWRDKIKYQKEFDKQVKDQNLKDEVKVTSAVTKESDGVDQDEDELGGSFLDMTLGSQTNRLRWKKIQKLHEESTKQENLLSKINRVLERITTVDEENLDLLVNIERHYLVASTRFQAALTEMRRCTDNLEPFQPDPPFNRKGKCIVSEIMLEVKQSYFERRESSHNEYVVVLLKYNEQIFASKPVCITSDIRTLKFPHKFQVPDAYMDFEMRLEVYGTTFWRQRNCIRKTMLKKYGFATFTLADSGEKRKRLELVEVIKSENNPLRKKVLLKIRQKITTDIKFEGNLMVKLGENWFKSRSVLCGNLLEINFIDSQEENATLLLDLYDFDNDFVISNVVNMTRKPFAFLLKFNHYVDLNNFQ